MIKGRGGSRGGGTPGMCPPPPNIEKNMIFWRKNVIFHKKYPQIFRTSLRNWKKYDFSHKIPPNILRLPPLGAIFLSAPPLTGNPGSAPERDNLKALTQLTTTTTRIRLRILPKETTCNIE